MKRISKHVILLTVLIILGVQGNAKNKFLDGFAGLLNITESFEKIMEFYNRMDDSINKQKVNNMVNDFYSDIGELIKTKDSIVYVLENGSFDEPKFGMLIDELHLKLNKIELTLNKYDDLITKAGIKTMDLKKDLENDFDQKATNLNNAKVFLEDHSLSDKEVKEQLITYFKTCINILNNAQGALSKFES